MPEETIISQDNSGCTHVQQKCCGGCADFFATLEHLPCCSCCVMDHDDRHVTEPLRLNIIQSNVVMILLPVYHPDWGNVWWDDSPLPALASVLNVYPVVRRMYQRQVNQSGMTHLTL